MREETIPVIFLEAVLRAIDHVLAEDGFAGDYLSDCRIRIVDGAYNRVDSSMNCYVMASAMAMRGALRDAGLYSHPSACPATMPGTLFTKRKL